MAFTKHGHHISGTTFNVEDRPSLIARCGGPGLCHDCSLEATRYTENHTGEMTTNDMKKVSSKDELLRAWSIERALEMGGATSVENVIYRAGVIEKFVKEGKQDG